MATFREHTSKDGVTTVMANIRIKRKGVIVHREAKTLPDMKQAKTWAKVREGELAAGGGTDTRQKAPTLGVLIRRYITEFQSVASFGRSKVSDLNRILGYPIAEANAGTLTSADLIQHVKWRRQSGASGATVINDLVWIGVAMRTALAAWDMKVNPEVVANARLVCRQHKLIARGKRRDRRPSEEETKRLDEHFNSRDGRAEIPMRDIFWFAIHSARRQGEIARLQWKDLDEDTHSILVRDVKHPREKVGNHKVAKFTDEALKIIQRQPRTGDLIFPYDGRSVGAAFTRACSFLEIDDLRFHDLRHEGTSRLFEQGYSIEQVAQFTLHDSWIELKRYANLRPQNLKLKQPVRRSARRPAAAPAPASARLQ